jgi:hypothetical protein
MAKWDIPSAGNLAVRAIWYFFFLIHMYMYYNFMSMRAILCSGQSAGNYGNTKGGLEIPIQYNMATVNILHKESRSEYACTKFLVFTVHVF